MADDFEKKCLVPILKAQRFADNLENLGTIVDITPGDILVEVIKPFVKRLETDFRNDIEGSPVIHERTKKYIEDDLVALHDVAHYVSLDIDFPTGLKVHADELRSVLPWMAITCACGEKALGTEEQDTGYRRSPQDWGVRHDKE